MTNPPGQQTVLSLNPYLELNNQGQVMRLELTTSRHVLGRDRGSGADLVVPPDWQVMGRAHAVLSQVGSEYNIYDGDGQHPSTNGLFLDRTRITPKEGFLLRDGTQIRIGQNPKDQIFLTYVNPASAGVAPKVRSLSLAGRSVVLGRDPSGNLQLDAPIVSRRHAVIDNYTITDYSTNGVFVNGQRVKTSQGLTDGATIRIGPFTLLLRGDELQVLDQGSQIRLDAEGLVREVKDGTKVKQLLNQVTLAIEPGQFVALVGGSGTGKSTLMRTLLGIDATTQGRVYINGDDLRTTFNIYRTQIGYVPQDDIIHGQLTAREVLTYAAKLRLPPDTDVEAVVTKTLAEIEMGDRETVLVNQLSGGQRKRVSIGVELLADPKLFFLDEPTSGLDPGLDKKMMQLLRKLADQGRTIVLVTHATANIKLCDRVVFMGRGGHPCYFGPPDEAFQFFRINSGDFADIYNELEQGEEHAAQWANSFRQSPYYRNYVENHLSTGKGSSFAPPSQVKPSGFQQLSLLTQRYFKLMQRDRINLGLVLLTAPIGISLITLAIRDKDPLIGEPEATLAPLALRVLFVFTCAAIWIGLSTSLQEIVKESAIYMRERLVNLGLFPYLGSKLVILGGLALLQTLLMVGAILIGFKSPQPELIYWPIGVGISTFLTLFTSMSLGLLVSALVKNSSQANSSLPLLLLPQIIFAGVLFSMEGVGRVISWLMLSRWSVGAYGSLVDVNAMVPEPSILPDGTTMPLPFEPTAIYEPTWANLGLNWGMLLLHATVYLGLTLWVQKRKDIF
ncbi:ATP-binding cassette domain-containing protein [Phormidium pseudopriestleyi FRX01]|uniref:ATP-binding cassette domain-containing protein n=1 Tax=Phormidium pseudopriestleyi FRX01 TaxID=1759528 RepID=A0ABS3FTL0_9CYAN|nr:ATP-binding cassette domain-containing protein [Phormidium pseudopriestleyi]MBO0350334.1 ATP-binding cassette domain-containing protein [Phormidium pseudopriestleyi FRX01]